MRQLRLYLSIAVIVVFCAVGTHYSRLWRGRPVASFADYVDFAGIGFMLLSITIATGMWKTKPNDPHNMVRDSLLKILAFGLKVIFLLFVPGALLAEWLRGWLFLGQRALVYGVFALVAIAGFAIARRLATKANAA